MPIRMNNSGKLREFLQNQMFGLRDGRVDRADISLQIKGAKEITASIYADFRGMQVMEKLGMAVYEVGKLPIGDRDLDDVKDNK